MTFAFNQKEIAVHFKFFNLSNYFLPGKTDGLFEYKS